MVVRNGDTEGADVSRRFDRDAAVMKCDGHVGCGGAAGWGWGGDAAFTLICWGPPAQACPLETKRR